MEPVNTVDPGELAPLRQLASELLAADAVEIGVLDRIASLASELAMRSREQARQKMVDLVEARALPLLPAAAADLRARLGPMSLDELSALSALLGQAVSARAAFEEADSGLMAARRRGDYAAMAPLAIEADAQNTALENATVGFTERLGLTGALLEQAPDNGVPALEPTPERTPETTSFAAASETPAAVEEPPPSADYGAADLGADAPTPESPPTDAEPAEAQPERRRLRALIRQMRPTTDEAPAAR